MRKSYIVKHSKWSWCRWQSKCWLELIQGISVIRDLKMFKSRGINILIIIISSSSCSRTSSTSSSCYCSSSSIGVVMMMITITIIIVVAVAVGFHIFPHTYYRSKHLYLSSLPRRPSPKVQSSFTQLIGCCHQYGGCDKTSESSFMKKINNSCRTAEGIFKVSVCPDRSVKWLEVAGHAGLI